jgi:hypothetical protein
LGAGRAGYREDSQKNRTLPDRTIPKGKPDIDLASLGLLSVRQIHCELILVNHLNFYVT